MAGLGRVDHRVVAIERDLSRGSVSRRPARCARRGSRSLEADTIEKLPRLPPRTQNVHVRLRPVSQDLGACVLRF
jgi:hypothetical protein